MKRKIAGMVLGLFAALVLPSKSIAGTLQDSQQKFYGAQNESMYVQAPASGVTPLQVTTSTGSPVLVLNYTGSAADAEVTIAPGGTAQNPTATGKIAFYAPGATLETTIGVGTAGNASGTFDLGVSSEGLTLGALCDSINQSNSGASNWHCTLVSGLRSDNSGQVLPTVTASAGINSAKANGGYAVPIATNTIISLGIVPASGKHVVLNGCYAQGAGNAAAPPSLYVYGVPIKYSKNLDQFGTVYTDSYQVHQLVMTSATSTYDPASFQYNSAAPWIEFAPVGGNPGAFPMGNGVATNVTKSILYGPIGANQYNGKVVVRVGAFAVGNGTQVGPTDFLTCNWTEEGQ